MWPDPVMEAVDLGRSALFLATKLSLPLLIVGLVVGLAVSILQAATQIQEQTLSFVPKILAVVATLFILLPWFLIELIDYTEDLFIHMGGFFLR